MKQILHFIFILPLWVSLPSLCSPTSSIPAEHVTRVVELCNLGVAQMDQYTPSEAAETFSKVVELAPNWSVGRLNLGIALLNVQSDASREQAELELRRVIEIEPGDPHAHYSLGVLLTYFGRFEDGKSQFMKVLEIDPRDADTLYQLGSLPTVQPEVARQHLETVLERVPNHESACYRLAILLRRMGEKELGMQYLERFKRLKTSGAGGAVGQAYGEMGRYAEIVRTFGDMPNLSSEQTVPDFMEIARQSGLTFSSPAEAFGPGVAAADVNGDGQLDIFIPDTRGQGNGGLYLNREGRFSALAESGIDSRDGVAGTFADYDADGDMDLYLTRAGRNRLYQNNGQAKFVDVTEASGMQGEPLLSLGAAWADADHDGDLDLFVANYGRFSEDSVFTLGAPNELWRNNGDGTFQNVAPDSGLGDRALPSTGVVLLDIDEDLDLDVFIVNDAYQVDGGGVKQAHTLYLNHRIGRYEEAGARYPELRDAGPAMGCLLGDLNLDGREDLLLLRRDAAPRLFLKRGRDGFKEDAAFAVNMNTVSSVDSGAIGDLDLDGDLDLVLLGAKANGFSGRWLLLNDGEGDFAQRVVLGEGTGERAYRGSVTADFDGDGGLELLTASVGAPPELWRAAVPEGRHWLAVSPIGALPTGGQETGTAESLAVGVGMFVEVKTGRHLQVASIVSSSGYLGSCPPRAHFGLGTAGKVDYVRMIWPDGMLQSEMEVPAGQRWPAVKITRKPSSCPVLFSWDGERFACVTDFLGVGGMGFFIEPGVYAPPDPTENVRIPPEQIAPRDGEYLLRIAEPLEEISYVDELKLLVYDHPGDWEVYPDERFTGSPPFPTGEPLAFAENIFPVAARNTDGDDVLDKVLEVDRTYVEPPVDPRFVGYASDHWLELDFGDRLASLEPGARLVLVLDGWVEYTYSHVNYAAYQAGIELKSPWIEVPDGEGGWRVAMREMGFPAGLPRTMTLDVSKLPLREDGRLRIRSNMEVFWDRIFVAVDVAGVDEAGPGLRETTLECARAEMRYLGYPREYSPDGSPPNLYDYRLLDHGLPMKNMNGRLTRFGDVCELLRETDDRYAILGRGEEIALAFDATSLPTLPEGWARTLVLLSVGYCKDTDLYTAFPHTVEPLPYRAMLNYPPKRPYPRTPENVAYLKKWNTRRVLER